MIVVQAEAERVAVLSTEARRLGLVTAEFREPDLDDRLTAVAFEPSPVVAELLGGVPLAGRQLV